MLQRHDIEHLAMLARVEISDAEKEEIAGQLDSVLSYVSEIGKVATDSAIASGMGELRNVMRDDTDAFPGGEYTETMLANAPFHDDGFVKVRQIF